MQAVIKCNEEAQIRVQNTLWAPYLVRMTQCFVAVHSSIRQIIGIHGSNVEADRLNALSFILDRKRGLPSAVAPQEERLCRHSALHLI